jgi:Protein of unknown function (DUF1364)
VADLRKLAAGRPCLVRLPGCDGGGESGTTVLGHLRLSGISGMGLKSPNFLGAWICGPCHRRADTCHDTMTQLTFYEGIFRTQAQLIKEGHVK